MIAKGTLNFVVHHNAFGLPNMLFEMHPCGLHVCYPKNMGEFGFVGTVEDSMKLFSKRQIDRAVRARDLFEKMIYPSTADFQSDSKCRWNLMVRSHA